MGQIDTAQLRWARIPRRYWNGSFSEIPDEDEHKKLVLSYLRKFDEAREKGLGLWLWSNENGTGKTAILGIIGRIVIKMGLGTFFIRFEDLCTAKLEGEIFNEEMTVWDRVKSVPILLLDDVGKEVTGKSDLRGFRHQLLEDLLRTRAQENRITIASSNIDPRNLAEHYQSEDMVSVIRESMIAIAVKSSRNWRAEKQRHGMTLLEGDE